MATGFPVKANYATGDVLTAANMNDLSGTLNYLQYMPPRNPVLNSNFSVWQRGTSISVGAAYPYTADRWQAVRGGVVAGMTVSRQATGDTTNLPNIQYCARLQRDSGNTSTGSLQLFNAFESVNSIPYAGKAVTFSFYARAGANYSGGALGGYVVTGTGTDQNPITSVYTGSTTAISVSATLTTTWQRFTGTATLSASATELNINFAYTPTGTAGTNDYVEITGVQLELGSVANTYMPNQPTYQAELAACQRYYYRQTAPQGFSTFGTSQNINTTQSIGQIPFPVTMRVYPTSIDYSTLALQPFSGGSVLPVTSLAFDTSTGNTNWGSILMGVASGLTAAGVCRLIASTSTSAYLGFNAEL